MKKIKTLLKIYKSQLKAVYTDEKEIEAIFYNLLENFYSVSKIDVILNPQLEIEEEKLLKALEKLKNHLPWQYITGNAFFYGLELKVNPHVLIPRPETEELVQWIIDEHTENPPKKILDIGTGSGAIAISLSKNFPDADVYAMDISDKALKVAELNAKKNNVKLNLIQSNVLELDEFSDKFDLIVSNPPYVRELEKQYMRKNVLDFEPETALFVPDENPLLFYDKIIDLAKKNSRRGGELYFEINEFLKPELEELLQKKGLSKYSFKKDIFDKWRMLKISFE